MISQPRVVGPQNIATENDDNNNTNPDFSCKVLCSPNNNIKVLQKVCVNNS